MFTARREYRGDHTDTVDPDDYWVELRDEIMATECDPLQASNFIEAMENSDERLVAVAVLLREGKFKEAGEETKNIARHYWESIANKKADERLDVYINERLADEGYDDFDDE
jgi:hypothetical protein